METPVDAAASLRENEWAAALPYVEYPPTPVWYPAAVGVWTSVLLGAVLYLHGGPAYAVTVLALLALEIGFIAWYRRKRGTMPSLRGAPAEFHRVFRLYFIGLVALLAAVVAAGFLLPRPFAIAICLVGVTAGLTVYERVYGEAAAATRARLR